jgi:hypothetical protein
VFGSKNEEFPVAEAKFKAFEVLFPERVVFPSTEEVNIGPVGCTVTIEFVKVEKIELLELAVAIEVRVVKLACEVTVERDAVDVANGEVLVTLVA